MITQTKVPDFLGKLAVTYRIKTPFVEVDRVNSRAIFKSIHEKVIEDEEVSDG